MQLKINKYSDTVFEWIPYNEIIIIAELEHYTSAIWKKGPLYYTDDKKLVESYLKSGVIFGISQNPDTKVHILVFYNEYLICYCEKCGNKYENRIYKWCKQCEINQLKNNFTNWTNRNEKVDNFIQKMQLNINDYHDKIFEWISYNKFIIIKELENYSLAIWEKDNTNDQKSVGKSREKVYLKYLYNSQEITADFSNEVESYLENKVIFGISQNPDTEVYLLVFNVEYFDRYCEKCDWTSGNEKVDNFIQKMQLKVNVYQGGIFEWISYNEFIEIKEIENNVLATAIWKDGPLYYSSIRMSYNREINIKVILKYLCNSQNVSHLSLSEVIYSVEENYGITQNPNTKDYMLVCKIEYYCEICGKKYNNQFERNNKSCISCQTNHENKKIHDLIQEIKLNIDHNSGDFDIMFEWIPYDQFNDIKEIGKGGFSTVYSAIWKDGVLFYDCNPFKTGWKRQSNTKVALKCLNNSQNFLDEFVNEVKAYTNQKIDNILKIYGISQNPNTKEYIMVLEYAEDDSP
uniref:Protein kinase domain-containing protein n=1 Tax=Rhizophagus irregularis (strain DAOM 181602 / DAOM 197198 / MUCL 43194) TaxID=747089 RepID=U9TK16_RHIID